MLKRRQIYSPHFPSCVFSLINDPRKEWSPPTVKMVPYKPGLIANPILPTIHNLGFRCTEWSPGYRGHSWAIDKVSSHLYYQSVKNDRIDSHTKWSIYHSFFWIYVVNVPCSNIVSPHTRTIVTKGNNFTHPSYRDSFPPRIGDTFCNTWHGHWI